MLRFKMPNTPAIAFARQCSTSTISSKYLRDTGLFINGKEVFEGERIAVKNPADNNHLFSVPIANPGAVSNAIEIANNAFHSGVWAQSSAQHRAEVLNKTAHNLRKEIDELAVLETLQTGRPLREMSAQLQRLPEWFEYFSAIIRTHEGSVKPFKGDYLNYVERVPLGVVAQITPWNHPLLIAVKKLAPALATGNSVIIKPSELAPATAVHLARICNESGIPEGVVNVITGGIKCGESLVSDPRISKIDLTGGTETGRRVGARAGEALTGMVAELGGKAPVVVFDDCSMDQTVNGCAFASFIAAGQTCIMGARIIVHEKIVTEFTTRFVEKIRSLKLGHPFDASTDVGAVISEIQLEKIDGFVQMARNEGASVLCGGRKAVSSDFTSEGELLEKGHFYLPTVIGGNVHSNMRIVQEEVFGPVVVVYSFKDEEEAIQLANGCPFGLGASVWTNDVKRAHRVAKRLNAGITWINDHHRNDPSSPWGGMANTFSGFGRENGTDAFHEYTQSKSIVVNLSDSPFDWFSPRESFSESQRYS